jgi:polyisoprenoid-binding protein YceI
VTDRGFARAWSTRLQMGIRWTITAGLVGLCLAMPKAIAATYEIDSDHTEIRFSWDHLGMSRQSGRFTSISGTVEFDPADPEASRVEVTIKAASILTGIEPLDKQLRSADYFNVARYPTITFVGTSVRAITDRTGELTGNLTMMGMTRPVTLNVVWNYAGEYPLAKISPNFKDKMAAGFSATARIKRSEWGLDRSVPLITDEIQITFGSALLACEADIHYKHRHARRSSRQRPLLEMFHACELVSR